MKKFSMLVAFVIVAINLTAQNFNSGTEIIRQMHKKYFNGPCRSYSFSQKNTHYKADTVAGRSEWHENVEFPDKFRIHFGDRTKGNYVVFRNDSVFNFKENKQIKMRPDSNTLLLLLGGMYYRDINDVLTRMKAAGYNTEVLSRQNWNDTPVYVVGAASGDTLANQIWIDQKNLRVVRIIEKMNETDMMDMRFEAHQDWCKGYVETKVSFRRNGKLEQVEEYYNIIETKSFWE